MTGDAEPFSLPNQSQSTVYIVFPDALLRRMVARALAGDGYQVLEASSASESDHFAACPRPTLLVLDVMAWPDSVRALRWADRYLPAVPRIVVVPGGIVLQTGGDPPTARLSTPFDLSDLRRAIALLRR